MAARRLDPADPDREGRRGRRFDPVAGWREMRLRQIGHDEAAVVQTMLAIVDASATTRRWIR